MAKVKPAKTPWTKAQRSKLTAILQAHPNDPPDFVPTAAQAWSATGLGGEPPSVWTPALERSLIDRAWDGDADLDALVHFLVAARGLEVAIATIRRVRDPEGELLDYSWFRRHLQAADDGTFARVRELLTAKWDALGFSTRVGLAFTLSRDPSLARGLVEALPDDPFHVGPLMVAVGDATLARRALEASSGKLLAFTECFDLVEALGGDAAPLLQGVLDRFDGKAVNRKPIEQALKLASALPRSEATLAAAPVAKPTRPALPEEAIYEFDEVVVAGSFKDLDADVIDLRLRVRGLRRAGTPGPRTRGYFEGADANPALRGKAAARGVPIFGEADLERLLATPLYRFRERFAAMVAEALADSAYTVHAWSIGAPATAAELAAAEAAIGAPLDPGLRAFYSQCNGVQLRADVAEPAGSGARQTLAARPLAWGTVGSPYTGELGGGTAGVVAILALDELIKTRGYGRDPASAGSDERVKIGRRALPMRTFLANMYLLDGWYDYYPVALVCDPQRGSFSVVVGDDHGAVWDDPDPESFERYLESALGASFWERPHGRRRFRRAQ